MRFVNNPVFQTANTVDVNLAKKASEDLETSNLPDPRSQTERTKAPEERLLKQVVLQKPHHFIDTKQCFV
jgi:hypothetical protein